jgi:hypothetical protein
VRELSEIAMTGAAWITEYELHYIVNRVRELEENLNLRAKSYDANSKGWQADIAELRARHAALVKAANKFVKKIDMVHNDPAYYGVWATSQMHIGEYKGPKYDGELDELKAALAEVK